MPGNDLARQIKEHLTARQVVELYGFHPDRGGYIQCPFHAGDNHGSLKVYDGDKSGWHCFGCGAGGSVIDFVMRLFGLSFAQACLKLNCDFGLGLTGERPSMAERSALLEARRREAQEKEAAAALYREKAAEYSKISDANKKLDAKNELWHAVRIGMITAANYKTITGEDYPNIPPVRVETKAAL